MTPSRQSDDELEGARIEEEWLSLVGAFIRAMEDPEGSGEALITGTTGGTVPPVASGQTRVRMPADLHEALQRKADAQRVSLNTLMVALLAGGIGFRLPKETR